MFGRQHDSSVDNFLHTTVIHIIPFHLTESETRG